VLWVVPFAGVHYLTYRKQFWRVGGSLRKHLSTLLLKKFLNYTDNSRNEVAIQELLMAMVRSVHVLRTDISSVVDCVSTSSSLQPQVLASLCVLIMMVFVLMLCCLGA